MKIFNTAIPEVLLIKPKVLTDSRGFFFEHWHRNRYQEVGLPKEFAQDNISFSKEKVLRGLHFQHPNDQGKLISVLAGEIFDVAVDIRPNSPNFKQWVGFSLSSENHHQLWIPKGFAHGFLVMSSSALVSYKSTDFYNPQNELTLLWNDPELNIEWPAHNPELSEKDLRGISISEIDQLKLPKM